MDELVTLDEDTYVERDLPGGGTTQVLVGRKGQRVPASRLEGGGPVAGVPHTHPGAEPVEAPPRNASTEEWADYAVASDQATRDEVDGLSRADLIDAYAPDEGDGDGDGDASDEGEESDADEE